MIGLLSVIVLVLVFCVLAYQRASLIIWTMSYALFLLLFIPYHGFSTGWWIACILFLLIFLPLNIRPWRRRLISQHVLRFYRTVMPSMSRTEREAIAAGSVSWEGDLFRGDPNWQKLLAYPKPVLSSEEQAFLDGPVEKLCSMIDDWDITHNRADIPPHVWSFIKEQGFFGLIIPKQYGGKEFSAYAHSQILVKISSRSITVSSTVAVPNSLGPAELLLHYGTDEQKNYYLPRLARGEEIPCFALTSSVAGSDAGAMVDHGIVCWDMFEGKKILGIRLTFDKRYITLAPIATVVGLAFKLHDPDHLLGQKKEIGITCALIPRNTPGVSIGRRHFPMNTPFQNGPIHGKDVFIPLDWIIGGVEQAGKGWRMLMECLAAGRAISLPASALGGAKVVCYGGGAYARIRKQFNTSISRFEGIETPLSRIAGYTYIMDAARSFATSVIDTGQKPAIASAIVKYHVTELARKVGIDGMDIHGGKGICLGPKNYLGRGYEGAPIAITVEGANILTRSLIIFGQGVMRCHPYILPELEAAKMTDEKAALKAFDKALFGHMAFSISNVVRSFILGLTSSFLVRVPDTKLKRYYQHSTRFSSALALFADVSMLVFGGSLKRRENISARLGDILSHLYLLSAVLKHYHDQGENSEDLLLVRYAGLYCLFQIQERFDELIKNFPNRWLAAILKCLIFPIGQRFQPPMDRLNHKISQLISAPTPTRERVTAGAYLTATTTNVMSDLQDALVKTIASEPIEKIIKTAKSDEKISGYDMLDLAQDALDKKIITLEQFDVYLQAREARKKVIAVDDFAPEELARVPFDTQTTSTET